MQAIQAVRGMNDVLPDQSPLWEYFEQTVRDWLADYGYRNMRMPVLEKTDLFVRSIGEVTDIVEKEMYTFVDQLNGDSLTLRPEGTASCVRAAIQHNLLYTGPCRVFYSGPMFRHERPQKGRFRQFHQVGVEALGFAGPDVDAEHMVMGARLWKRLGLEDVSLEINTLGDSESRARYRDRLVAYLESRNDELDEDSRRRLRKNPLRVLDSKNPAMKEIVVEAPQLLDDLDEAGRPAHLDRVDARSVSQPEVELRLDASSVQLAGLGSSTGGDDHAGPVGVAMARHPDQLDPNPVQALGEQVLEHSPVESVAEGSRGRPDRVDTPRVGRA